MISVHISDSSERDFVNREGTWLEAEMKTKLQHVESVTTETNTDELLKIIARELIQLNYKLS